MPAKLTAAQAAALATIERDGVLHSFNGVSIATVRALASHGLIDLTVAVSTVYGPLGTANGCKGRTFVEFVATRKELAR